jgi:RHS repeat-associated protein
LVFGRQYRSDLVREDRGIGYGWTHNLAWRIERTRSGLRVFTGSGELLQFPEATRGIPVIGPYGYSLALTGSGFALRGQDELVRQFEFEQDGVWYLTSVTFRSAHRIALSWQGARLGEVLDPAGRVLRMTYTPQGRIAELSGRGAGTNNSWVRLAEYSYSPAGDLIAAIDAEGNTTRYDYDEGHRLVRVIDAVGVVVHYRYDRQSRCVESWVVGPDGPNGALTAEEEHRLADGETRAKGMFHCKLTFGDDGFVEVVDSQGIRNCFANETGSMDKVVADGSVITRAFDPLGFERSVTDPLEGTTTYTRDECGRITSRADALGHRWEFIRDNEGRVISFVDPLGYKCCFDRDPHGNLTRFVDYDERSFEYRWERGFLVQTLHPAGYAAYYEYNHTGDLERLLGPDGYELTMRYDEWGRLVAMEQGGTEERFGYSLFGDLIYHRTPSGAETRYLYDGAHKLIGIVYPDGLRATIERGGFHLPVRVTKPDGTTFEMRYDREGRVKVITNALRQRHTFERTAEGFIVGEKTFDDRNISYRYDAGRRLTMTAIDNERTFFEYDAVGNLIRCEYADGSQATFEYDARGLLVRAKNGAADVVLQRDAVGRVVKETQLTDDEEIVVESSYDASGLIAFRQTGLGHRIDFSRLANGLAQRVTLDRVHHVDLTFTIKGAIESMQLPAKGLLRFQYDPDGRLLAEEQVPANAGAVPVSRRTAPDLAGVSRSPYLALANEFNQRGDLVRSWDLESGTTEYQYDALGQIVSRTSEHGVIEAFSYDAAGNQVSMNGSPVELDESKRPRRVGDQELRFDRAGRLIGKRDGDGVWVFTWNGGSELARVQRPDGTYIDFAYDALGRRVQKRFCAANGAVLETKRFVWSRELLIHEVSYDFRTASHSGCTYWIDRSTSALVATRGPDGEWLFSINRASRAPHKLVNGAAMDDALVSMSTFGDSDSTATPQRFPGQYSDAETGLCYNRFRYYAPQLARYISPDPIGLLGGLNAYRYVENRPTTDSDPLGLFGLTTGFLVLNDGTVIPGNGQLMPSGQPGTYVPGRGVSANDLDRGPIPANTSNVQAAIPPQGPGMPKYPPGVCAEAHLMSELERRGYQPSDIAPGGMVIMDARTLKIKEPCNYCGAMLSNLGVQPSQIRTA